MISTHATQLQYLLLYLCEKAILGQENKIHCFSGPPASVQLPPGFYFILARNRPRPGALWRGAQYHNSPLCVHMRVL